MPKISFYHKEKELATTFIKDRSNQVDRDIVASEVLDLLDYQVFDKFVITDDDGKNPRSATLTPYFQDAQGRIWKAEGFNNV